MQRAGRPLVERACRDALMDELGALSVSVEDADADTADEQALFGEPGMPAPQRAAGSARRCARCSPTRRPPRPLPRCCWRRTGPHGVQRAVAAAGARPGLGAADAVAVRRRWPYADASGSCPAGTSRRPARSASSGSTRAWPSAPAPTRPRACACAGSPRSADTLGRLGARARLRLRLGHPGHRRGAARRARHRRGRHRPGRRGVHRRPTRGQRRERCAPACPTGPRAATRWCWPTSWPRR